MGDADSLLALCRSAALYLGSLVFKLLLYPASPCRYYALLACVPHGKGVRLVSIQSCFFSSVARKSAKWEPLTLLAIYSLRCRAESSSSGEVWFSGLLRVRVLRC